MMNLEGDHAEGGRFRIQPLRLGIQSGHVQIFDVDWAVNGNNDGNNDDNNDVEGAEEETLSGLEGVEGIDISNGRAVYTQQQFMLM